MPFLFGLAPDGVYLARLVALAAVRSYRTLSAFLGRTRVVFSLWHFPSMNPKIQRLGVTQHPALMEPGLSSQRENRFSREAITLTL